MTQPLTVPEASITRVVAEIIMGRYRLTGELRLPGLPRRFVDLMNALERSFAVAFDAVIEPLSADGDGEKEARLDVVQLQPEAILFAIKRGGDEPPPNSFEAVKKVPVPSVIVLPGFKIVGKVWEIPGADPLRVALVGKHQFVPVTEAEVFSSYGAVSWHEPFVAVNMGRALLYAPQATERGRGDNPGPDV